MKIKKIKFDIFFLIICILILTVKFEFFLNIYIILKNNIHSRMVAAYDFCYPQGYGFIKDIIIKNNLEKKNITTKNFLNKPNSNIFHYSFKNSDSTYEVVRNYDSKKLNSIKNNVKIM